MPSSYKKNTLPLPKNNSIFFNTEYNQFVASIEFGGFANDQICNIKHKELKAFLISKEIAFKNDLYSSLSILKGPIISCVNPFKTYILYL